MRKGIYCTYTYYMHTYVHMYVLSSGSVSDIRGIHETLSYHMLGLNMHSAKMPTSLSMYRAFHEMQIQAYFCHIEILSVT